MEKTFYKSEDVIKALSEAGVSEYVLPKLDDFKKGTTGQVWSGKKKNGYHWKVIKRSATNYRVSC